MKKKKSMVFITILLALSLFAAGCSKIENTQTEQSNDSTNSSVMLSEENPAENNSETELTTEPLETTPEAAPTTEPAETEPTLAVTTSESVEQEGMIHIVPTTDIVELADGLSTVRYDDDYGFEEFLEQGGASSDDQVVDFLINYLLFSSDLKFSKEKFGCSTLSAKSPEGDQLFGRNFDWWDKSDALIISSRPENAYASISTVNIDLITTEETAPLISLSPKILTVASLYAPLDGMNEKGLCISVNMIQDSVIIDQNTDKTDITTTTAVRLMLNQAANVEEALDLLDQYDMHSSMNMMIHFALADAEGRSVVVEYLNNEMIVTETPVVTNFYFAEEAIDDKGTEQSYQRYQILIDHLAKTENMSMENIKDALASVSQEKFGDSGTTEWSIIFNQNTKEIQYYHRENYETGYIFTLE